jgi:hypothetical protein
LDNLATIFVDRFSGFPANNDVDNSSVANASINNFEVFIKMLSCKYYDIKNCYERYLLYFV